MSRATFILKLWSRMAGDKLGAGITSLVDDFVIITKQVDANATWDKTAVALKETGPKSDEAKSHYSREWRTEWALETLQHTENLVVLGTGATERNSMMVDDSDTSMAKKRQNDQSCSLSTAR